MSKFITRLQRHSQKVHREDDGAVHYDDVIDECQKRQFDKVEYWSVEKSISTLARGGGEKKKVSMLLDSELSSSIPVPSSNSRTFRKCYQSCIARQCTVTQKVLPSTCITSENGKELRSIENHGLIPGGVGLRTGRQAVFFTFVNPESRWLRRNPMRFNTSKNRAIQKLLETLSEYSILVQYEAR